MILSALLLMVSTPALDQSRCRDAYYGLERRTAEFKWLVVRAEYRQWFTEGEARLIRNDADLTVRPFLDDIREIAPYASGDTCEMIAREGWHALVEGVIAPYRAEVIKIQRGTE